ncbi:class I SAM-dependent methyltransferase [uncultured Psychroserpens sp.]|uniref:class I SAM-dependent methyltransferase n=1 Tax=uncultured Psychroserpens sp. TaxID=255436 RepID=UPI0026230C21|nr:class I SAM-dependent methyltransferase [uncultured Psychroserpens sp.]
MDKYQETFNTWDRIAKRYQDQFMGLDLYDDTYNVFLGLIQKTNASILDIGCGPGNITKYLLTQNPNLSIKGIDISKNMIQLAKKNNPTAVFEIMDTRNLLSIDKTFDAIVCGFCIPYMSQQDCKKFITNCRYLLKNFGILYLSFVSGDYDNSGFISGSTNDRTYFYYHNLDMIKKELEINAFTIIKEFTKKYITSNSLSENHTVLIAIMKQK